MSLYKRLEKQLAKLTFNTQDRLTLYEDLAFLLENNQKLLEAITVMRDSKGKHSPEIYCLNDMLEGLSKGQSLDVALKEWIPQYERAILAAGNREGNIVPALKRVGRLVNSMEEMKSTIKSALGMPLVLFLGMMVSVVMFSWYFLPQLAKMFPREHWQGSLKVMATITDLFGQHVLAWCMGIMVLSWATLYSLPNLTGRLRKILDYCPPWSLYRQVQGITFLLNFSALTHAQTQTDESIAQLMRFASPWLYERLSKVRQGLHKGLTLGLALRDSGYLFPSKLAIDRLVLLTQGDNAIAIIEKFAYHQLSKTLVNVKKLASTINTLVMLLSGGYIALVGFSVQSISTFLI